FSRESRRETAAPGGHGNVLPAPYFVGCRLATNRSAGLELPQQFTGCVIKCHGIALLIAGENQPTSSRQRATQKRIGLSVAPLNRPGGRINGREMAVGRLIVPLCSRRAATPEGNALDKSGRRLFHLPAALDDRHVHQLGRWAVSGGVGTILAADR